MRLARFGQAIGVSLVATVSVVSVRGGMALGHLEAQERTTPIIHAGAAVAPPRLEAHTVGGGQRRAAHRSQAFAPRRMNRVSPG